MANTGKQLAILALALMLGNFASAAAISDITAPITKIADLAKGIVSVLGVIAITVSGALYMFSGNNIVARENAKSMVSYAVAGLVLVWVAPFLVSYLTSPAA